MGHFPSGLPAPQHSPPSPGPSVHPGAPDTSPGDALPALRPRAAGAWLSARSQPSTGGSADGSCPALRPLPLLGWCPAAPGFSGAHRARQLRSSTVEKACPALLGNSRERRSPCQAREGMPFSLGLQGSPRGGCCLEKWSREWGKLGWPGPDCPAQAGACRAAGAQGSAWGQAQPGALESAAARGPHPGHTPCTALLARPPECLWPLSWQVCRWQRRPEAHGGPASTALGSCRASPGLTSVQHGPLAQLRPAAACCEEGVVGYHGGVVASPSPSAFRAPPPVGLERAEGGHEQRGRARCLPPESQVPPSAGRHLPTACCARADAATRGASQRGQDLPCLSPLRRSCQERWRRSPGPR